MKQSESISTLAPALVQAIAELKNPPRTSTNPFFRSKYTPLDLTLDTLRPVLHKHGLCIIQNVHSHPLAEPKILEIGYDEKGVSKGQCVVSALPAVLTRITHKSAEWIETEPFIMPVRGSYTAPDFGMCVSYARRYQIDAIVSIFGDTDDDGNSVSGRGNGKRINPALKDPVEAAQNILNAQPAEEEATNEGPSCPKCGAEMKIKKSKQGKEFWGCVNFPECRGTANVTTPDANGDIPF